MVSGHCPLKPKKQRRGRDERHWVASCFWDCIPKAPCIIYVLFTDFRAPYKYDRKVSSPRVEHSLGVHAATFVEVTAFFGLRCVSCGDPVVCSEDYNACCGCTGGHYPTVVSWSAKGLPDTYFTRCVWVGYAELDMLVAFGYPTEQQLQQNLV